MATDQEGAYEPTEEELNTEVDGVTEEAPEAEAAPATTETQAPDYEGWAVQNGYTKQQPAMPDPVDDPRFAIIEEIQYNDTRRAEELRMEIATERAVHQMRQEFAPLIAPGVQRDAIAGLGLEGEAAKYVAGLLSTESPQGVQFLTTNPVTRELLTRAGRDYEREKTPVRPPRHESAHSETGPLNREEQAAAADFERQFGIKADAKLIAMARKDAAARMN